MNNNSSDAIEAKEQLDIGFATSCAATLGLLISSIISIKLSVDLFASAANDNEVYKWLYGGIAIALELAKYILIVEAYRYYRLRNEVLMLLNGAGFVILSAVSIAASMGSIQNNATTAIKDIQRYEQMVSDKRATLNNIQTAIRENQSDIKVYQELKLIEKKVDPLKRENKKYLKESEKIINEINGLKVPDQSSTIALSKEISKMLGISREGGQRVFASSSSFLLEFFIALFAYLVARQGAIKKGSFIPRPPRTTKARKGIWEILFDRAERKIQQAEQSTKAGSTDYSVMRELNSNKAKLPKNVVQISKLQQKETHSINNSLQNKSVGIKQGNIEERRASTVIITDTTYEMIKDSIEIWSKDRKNWEENEKACPPSKRKIMQKYGIGEKNATRYFNSLIAEGFIYQKENKRFDICSSNTISDHKAG